MPRHFLNKNEDFLLTPDKKAGFGEKLKAVKTMDAESIQRMGYGGNDDALVNAIGTMDAAAQIGFNTPALSQFYQSWLTGIVRAHTAPRRAEQIIGYLQAGDFATETIVLRSLEQHADVGQYGDLADVMQASYTMQYPYRHVVRFLAGFQTRLLESMRATGAGVDDAEEKRKAVETAFAIVANAVAINGFNGGGNKTYGILNDPNLSAYVTVPNGAAASPLWSTKSWLEKVNDIRLSVNELATSARGGFDPTSEKFTWVIPTYIKNELSAVNDFGKTIQSWLDDVYPALRVETLPELEGANGGVDVWYMYKDEALNVDSSTDDGQTIVNVTQSKMFLISALPNKSGGVGENYGCAVAGVIVKRPHLVVRFTGAN